MEKTYSCKNGHKFKKEEAPQVTCPSCGEPASPKQWNSVEGFSSSSKGYGILEEMGSVVNAVKGKKY